MPYYSCVGPGEFFASQRVPRFDLSKEALTSMEVLPYLDRHLIYPILDFYQTNGLYTENEMLQAKLDLLQATNMPGHCADLYKQLHDSEEAPEHFAQKQTVIDRQLAELESHSQKILEVLEKPEVASALRQDKSQNLAFLRDTHGITIEQINVLFNLGQFDYNRGNYPGAIDHLYHFRVLSTDQKLMTAAAWGKLASEILTANWEDAISELSKLREQVDADFSDASEQLRNRTWLLHWALFPMHKSGHNRATELQELFFTPAYLNAIQTSAPHLLRYLTLAVLSTSFGKSSSGAPGRRLRDLVKILEAERLYSDPITSFASAVFSRYDFSAAKTSYSAIQDTISNDYFLASSSEAIMKSLKLAVAETYLRLHRTTEISNLAAVVDLEEAETITLVSEDLEHLNADIDLDDGVIEVMKEHSQSSLQDLVNKTKNLMFRSAAAQAAVPRLVR